MSHGALLVAGGATTLMTAPGLVGQEKAKKAKSEPVVEETAAESEMPSTTSEVVTEAPSDETVEDAAASPEPTAETVEGSAEAVTPPTADTTEHAAEESASDEEKQETEQQTA